MRKSVINYTLAILTVILALGVVLGPAHAQNPFNVFFNNTPASVNSGTKDGGTLRVAIATDQPALTNALKVDGSGVTQPVSGTVTANAGTGSFTVAQATAANLNATVVGTGTFATQATLQTQTDTVMIGGINVKEINGVTPLMGNGTSGTGSLRVNPATDTGAIANWGHGATGSAAPANATQIGVVNSTGLVAPLLCDTYVKDRSSTADVQLVAISGSTTIYVCGYRISGESTTGSDVSLEYGTGSACATGTTGMTPPTTVGTSTSGGMIGGVFLQPGMWSGLKTASAQGLCVHRSAAQTSEVEAWVAQK